MSPEQEPKWLQVARGFLGTRERLKNGDPNPLIERFFQETGFKGGDADDAWCSAFANFCMASAGLVGTRKANARSWLDWGERLEKPSHGAIVVFSSPPLPASGHVSFYVGEEKNWIHVFGGNQRNSVCEAPYARSRLLQYRWPRPADTSIELG